jgi:hypothetical protein
MRKTGYFVILGAVTMTLASCNFDWNNFFNRAKRAAKQTAEKIVVSDEKKESLRNSTNNYLEVDFELVSHKPFVESGTEVLDIASLNQKDYFSAFTNGMTTYEHNNGHANIPGRGYFSNEEKYLEYQDSEANVYAIQALDEGYDAKLNGETIDLSEESKKAEIDKAYKLWKAKLDYCFSFEINSFINFKARLVGTTDDDASKVDFLTSVVFKEYIDAGNYTAAYIGEAHKNVDQSDVKIDYIELKYVDYRLQYSLIHSVSTAYDSVQEIHTLSYSKFVYNATRE